MKILVINVSLRLGNPTKYLPVGVGSVMTYLRERGGYDFDFLDIDINDHSNEYVENFIASHPYDVVMAGSIVTHYKWVKWLCHVVKKYHPRTKIVIGNSVGGSIPEVFLKNSGADVAVIGEGEVTACAVLDAFRDGAPLSAVEGIAFIDDAENFVATPKRKATPIDDLPMINWDFFDVERYIEKAYVASVGLVLDENKIPRVMPIVTARGCVFKCTFCHYVFWNDPYRHRSAGRIIAEIRRNMEKYNANYIYFWDDLSFSALQQAEKIMDAIIESGLKFNWSAAIRADLFGNPQLPLEARKRVAKKFREAGCVNVAFSLESGNQEILEMMNKKIKVDYFYEQVRLMKDAGISCTTSVVFGYPLETRETIQQTFDQCFKAGVYPSIGFLLPLPYTKMYDYAKEHGFITDDDRYLDSITERQDICMNMTKLANEEIMGAIKENAKVLNEKLDLALSESRLIRTGGHARHNYKSAKSMARKMDPERLSRIENDVSLNYSQAIFTK